MNVPLTTVVEINPQILGPLQGPSPLKKNKLKGSSSLKPKGLGVFFRGPFPYRVTI